MSLFSPRFRITHSITAALTSIERARGFLEAATLSEQWIERMSERALLLEAHHTTHIEGTELTLDEAARLWAGEAVAGANRDDVRELLNYRDAFNLVAAYLSSGEPITEALIREIHKRLVKGVRGGSAQPGQYRKIQNFVANSRTREVIYTPPTPEQVPLLMRELVDWLRADTDIHPVLIAGIAQFQLVHIHPFVDGNGRSSRLLSTLCLYRSGYDFKRLFTLSEFYDRDRSAFYTALQGVREHSMDLTGWLDYFVHGLMQQLEEVKNRGASVIRADVQAHAQGLGARQAAVLAAIHQAGRASLGELEPLFPSVSRRSLQRDLKLLLDKGLILELASAALTDPNRAYGPTPGPGTLIGRPGKQ
ncbi:MAG: Fic family protein [Candidatus Cloacimonetes bacterium]|nr:Fic family protein [Candidatus Cloacimonadota bacterium]MCA9785282.1 Fic family protein [Candidatus Cloacimonadota bacterium]